MYICLIEVSNVVRGGVQCEIEPGTSTTRSCRLITQLLPTHRVQPDVLTLPHVRDPHVVVVLQMVVVVVVMVMLAVLRTTTSHRPIPGLHRLLLHHQRQRRRCRRAGRGRPVVLLLVVLVLVVLPVECQREGGQARARGAAG
jgi:hypothetical protein